MPKDNMVGKMTGNMAAAIARAKAASQRASQKIVNPQIINASRSAVNKKMISTSPSGERVVQYTAKAREILPTAMNQMDLFGAGDGTVLTYNKTDGSTAGSADIILKNPDDIMASNLFVRRQKADWYNKCNRYGWIDPYDTDRITREFLFFTKPDLNIFDGTNIYSPLVGSYGTINSNTNSVYNTNEGVAANSIIREAAARMPNVLGQLQASVSDPDGKKNPFMFLLSNAVSSKLDLPGISAESQESTSNIMGTSIQYRGHSLKSDNGFDFSLSFKDTAYLEIYTLVKCYDEYMRMIKIGEAIPKHEHIINRIIPEQFSIYKFLIGSDGETIIYYAKLTGCYFTDVPRSDMSDPNDEGIKYSISFHAQFVEDMNPQILKEFNMVAHNGLTAYKQAGSYMSVIDTDLGAINNRWARYPVIVKGYAKGNDEYSKRVARRNVAHDYFLKWVE